MDFVTFDKLTTSRSFFYQFNYLVEIVHEKFTLHWFKSNRPKKKQKPRKCLVLSERARIRMAFAWDQKNFDQHKKCSIAQLESNRTSVIHKWKKTRTSLQEDKSSERIVNERSTAWCYVFFFSCMAVLFAFFFRALRQKMGGVWSAEWILMYFT